MGKDTKANRKVTLKNRNIKRVKLDEPKIKFASKNITNQCHVCGKDIQNLNHHLFEKHGISKTKIDRVRDFHGYIIKICPKCGEEQTRMRDHLKRYHELLDTGVLDSLVKLAETVSGEYKIHSRDNLALEVSLGLYLNDHLLLFQEHLSKGDLVIAMPHIFQVCQFTSGSNSGMFMSGSTTTFSVFCGPLSGVGFFAVEEFDEIEDDPDEAVEEEEFLR
ncbi:Hypothetical predicted protein [Mytilus galloprovincialis]|uniref:Uncharacterized protein n=1 Tax=Mytilus galloprovincialis TaxID=29158 RepID=A0A8B6EB76_MYTGA|nr:Hypothetical predicted protein [Mytilus galloprovincialis]